MSGGAEMGQINLPRMLQRAAGAAKVYSSERGDTPPQRKDQPMNSITIPAYDPATENFADVGMDAWIDENGGSDASGWFPESTDLGRWIGDWADNNGDVFRLEVSDDTKEITASPLKVRILADFGEGYVQTDHVWTGAEWLAESRLDATILADCDEYYDGETRLEDVAQTIVAEW